MSLAGISDQLYTLGVRDLASPFTLPIVVSISRVTGSVPGETFVIYQIPDDQALLVTAFDINALTSIGTERFNELAWAIGKPTAFAAVQRYRDFTAAGIVCPGQSTGGQATVTMTFQGSPILVPPGGQVIASASKTASVGTITWTGSMLAWQIPRGNLGRV